MAEEFIGIDWQALCRTQQKQIGELTQDVCQLLNENIVMAHRVGQLEETVNRVWHLYAIGIRPEGTSTAHAREWTPADGLAARPEYRK